MDDRVEGEQSGGVHDWEASVMLVGAHGYAYLKQALVVAMRWQGGKVGHHGYQLVR